MAEKKVSLPKGFTSIGGFGESWKPTKKGASIEGVLLSIKKVKRKNVKKGENPHTQIATVRDKSGAEFQLWESARLRPLFTLKKGAKVFVRYDGMGKATQKGQNAPRLYTVATAK